MNILFSFLASFLLAGFAYVRKALTVPADILAFVFSLIICLCGGLWAFFVLVATFAFTILAGKLSKAKREEIEKKYHKKKGPRDAEQILCNVATGTVCILLYRLTGNTVFAFAYGGAMAASLADSMASELGVLSKHQPRLILSRETVPAGISGGVTGWGYLCSAFGGFIIGLISCWQLKVPGLVIISVSGLLAAVIDSLLGRFAQAKYRCPMCGLESEKPIHCSVPGQLAHGIRFISNDTVNFLNNLAGAFIAAFLSTLFFG